MPYEHHQDFRVSHASFSLKRISLTGIIDVLSNRFHSHPSTLFPLSILGTFRFSLSWDIAPRRKAGKFPFQCRYRSRYSMRFWFGRSVRSDAVAGSLPARVTSMPSRQAAWSTIVTTGKRLGSSATESLRLGRKRSSSTQANLATEFEKGKDLEGTRA